jgi:hypothetical protein
MAPALPLRAGQSFRRSARNGEKIMTHRPLIAIATIGVMAAFPVYAHHAATATFDTSQDLEIEGYVTNFNFVNPHVTITLDVEDENGVASEWVVTAPAVAGFRRWGWTQDTLEEGLLEVSPEDGSLVRVLTGPSPDQTPDDLARPELALEDGRPNLSGTWLAIAPGEGARQAAAQFNATGQALQDAFDPTQDPAYTRCEPRNLVGDVTAIQSVRVTQNDDYVVLEYEGPGTRRLVYLDGREATSDDHTRLGHSVARYEGDALVIETSQLLGGLSNGRGNALSDQMTLVETYRRADDADDAALEMTMVITDPGHLEAPWERSWRKVQTHDYEFADVLCRPPVRERVR